MAEEVERMASRPSPPGAVHCRNEACTNQTEQVLAGTAGAHVSFGETAIGNPRWRCSVCGEMFSRNIKAAARQREHHENKTLFKLSVDKMPVRRIIEVADIHPETFHHRLDFLHRRCRAFAARREHAPADLPVRRPYPGVDRRDHLVNRPVRKDKRNIRLSAIAAVDNEYGYCFGVHLNFDPSPDSEAVRAEVESNGDLGLPAPHRRLARPWLHADHSECRVPGHEAAQTGPANGDR